MEDTNTLRQIHNIYIRRHRKETTEIDGEELDKYETKGKVLGLDINTHGVAQQIKILKAMAQDT